MLRINRWLVVGWWLFIVSPSYAAVLNLPTVTVMADHNLGVAVIEIARDYSRSKQVVVNNSFASQGAQQTQISDGAAADILITSKEVWIDNLKLQGLIDIYSQIKLARDSLVLIGSVNSDVRNKENDSFPVYDIIKSGDGEHSLLLGNPEYLMGGIYAKEALRNLNVADDLEPYILYVKTIDDMMNSIKERENFAVCFNSTAIANNDIKIIKQIPETAHSPIIYNAVVIAGDNMDEARKFLEYLKTKEVKNILKKHGFIVED